jgi:hypothetical protein
VKDQITVILKSRQVYLKENKFGVGQPWNCEEHHWNHLKEVLAQEETLKG